VSLRPQHPLYFLVALIAASLLWYAATGKRRANISVRSTKANLTLVNMPRDLLLTSGVPDTVSLRLRGPLSVTPGPSTTLEVFVDLSDARAGLNSYGVDFSSIRLPPEVEVVAVEPAEIEIELERLQLRTLLVEPQIEGQPAPGFRVARIVANPTRLTVQGPESQLSSIDHVPTTPISIEGATNRIVARVEPVFQDRSLRVLTVSPLTVRVEIIPDPTPSPEEDTEGSS
jgi:YbbR domain-containing protein